MHYKQTETIKYIYVHIFLNPNKLKSGSRVRNHAKFASGITPAHAVHMTDDQQIYFHAVSLRGENVKTINSI